MAALTKAEKQLLRLVADQDLHANLLALRRAAERIWSEESPRIIPGYTFHGLTHSQRLVGYTVKLLAAHDGGKLTEREAYLLLASIYLHDIGMQCDVVRWPAIRARAEALGAKFDPEIRATNATNYSIDEQKAIRSNHHLLSAAWIDHASRTGETVLGAAASGIPRELIDDLMDVCKHHTKLPITECPLTFKRDPNERKQFVAALLRFADELDIDDNRVSIETVKNFNLDPRNSVYWWLHQSIRVIFSARSVVILNIWLHPDDFKEHGSFVHTAFITEFRSRIWIRKGVKKVVITTIVWTHISTAG